MKKGFWKKGFTLMEVIVVLVILAILLAIGIPTAINYMKLAEFRRNESHARTAYLAAESMLTWYRASGEWEEFRREVVHSGIYNDTFEEDDRENGRIYTIIWDRTQRETDSSRLVRTLLTQSSLGQELSDSAVAIEIDIETGQVYSAFYGTRCEGLSYHPQAEDGGLLDISAAGDSRSYENRRERLLGYYSAEDVTNVVDLKPTRLKITTINLVNSETLTLNWSSNSRHDNLDVTFHIVFYQENADASEQELFSADVNLHSLITAGFTENSSMAGLELKTADKQSAGTWDFPMTYDREKGRFSLVLDAMMSAELLEKLAMASEGTDEADRNLIRSYSTSITRLGSSSSGPAPAPSLLKPQDIYAVISVAPTYENLEGDSREYRAGSPVRSNTENTLFAGAEKTEDSNGAAENLSARISRYRHLSNIRFCGEMVTATYKLTARNMDWQAAGTGMYALETDGDRQVLAWQAVQGAGADFPSIRTLPQGQTLAGAGADTLLSNLCLGTASMPDDAVIKDFYKNTDAGKYTRYLGLFGEIEGTVRDLTLSNPVLRLTGEAADGSEAAASQWRHLWGVGILCGRSQGCLENITVRSGAGTGSALVKIRLAERAETEKSAPLGAGGLIGILAKKEEDGTLSALDDSARMKMQNLTMAGTVDVTLPAPLLSGAARTAEDDSAGDTALDAQEQVCYGTGGIAGYGQVKDGVQLAGCKNTAAVTGNLMAGGIAGNLTGDYNETSVSGAVAASSIRDCHNEGLVLCSAAHSETTWDGRYFGGILGFGNQVWIQASSSASGRASNYRYTEAEREKVLLGRYVGGILGYGVSSQLTGCSTRRDGYVLGSDYVGGIAGGLSNNIAQVIKGEESGITVTVNACYVIGNRYVGGIVGKNGDGSEESVIEDCVNNGVAAGYECYIGGIVGYNGENGVVKNCASYLSDYDNSVFQMITQSWKTVGDCVGGLAGYNNGKIVFKDAKVTVKSVSSIVVGRNFAGGIIGFNDVGGKLEVDYTLIGGRIYGYGDGIGGCIGLNASQQVLEQTLTIRPAGITGRYCVGGAIGANVVNLSNDVTMDGFHVDNRLGSMEGTAFTGGVIGYQRTYTDKQLIEEANKIGIQIPVQTDGRSLLLPYLLYAVQEDSAGGDGEENQGETAAWLPRIGEGNLPTDVLRSENGNRLIIARKNEIPENNNISIRSCLYTGGVVGACEPGSRLVLRNCKNTGNMSLLTDRETLSDGVSLKAYLQYAGIALIDQEDGQIPDISVHMSGGVISGNLENQVIDSCVNTGNMSGFVGLGGIVSFNGGGVFNCVLEGNFGSATLDCIGGIAGLNGHIGGQVLSYQDTKGKTWQYTSGTIAGCRTQAGRIVSGRHYVGGIAGLNMARARLTDNSSEAGINAAGDYVGGLAGANAGTIEVAADTGTASRVIQSASGSGVGGIVGWNQAGGRVVAAVGDGIAREELVVVNSRVRILADRNAGGIIGKNEGEIDTSAGFRYLVCQAEEIRTRSGYAGGIVGDAAGGSMRQVKNRSGSVTADRGPAGGIVAVNESGMTLEQCINLGSVNSDSGYAGGITAENYGTIANCQVGGDGELTIRSRQKDAAGAVCAVNHKDAKIENSAPAGRVTLSGQAETAGGITGQNDGLITGGEAGQVSLTMPVMDLQAAGGKLSVGGAAGKNTGTIREITVAGASMEDFYGYQYLGGITGQNLEEARIEQCVLFGGKMTERTGSGAAGNCYGGIVGENRGTLENCTVRQSTIEIGGVYTATSTSTAAQKEALSSHVGGIAGKNEETGRITGCLIDGSAGQSVIRAKNGMAGGIAGYNKGTITLSGDASVQTLMKGSEDGKVASVQELTENAGAAGIRGDAEYVDWSQNAGLENFLYNGSKKNVTAGRSLQLVMTTNGNLGGITAYNAPTGRVDYCATGNWYLNNCSDAIGVGTGGIIGMNESEYDLSFLLNRAFVGRQLSSNNTNRFAGGIIGNQNNTTKDRWSIRNCVNYGTVYCLRTHYSGGILGQWTGTGGTIENCRNYGNLQTTYGTGWVGASGGIVAQLYHAYEGHEYNIISCGNYGNIYGRSGRSIDNCANDSAGILGNITAYGADGAGQGQRFTIQVLDCVNASGVEIYSNSMASGIVGFFSCDAPSVERIKNATGKIELRIERCRNFAAVLKGRPYVAGIFGDRYGEEGALNTTIADCFSLNRENIYYDQSGFPVISLTTGNSSPHEKMRTEENYYLWGFGGQKDVDTFRVNSGNPVTIPSPSASLSRAGAAVAYYLTVGGKQYFVALTPGRQVNKNNLRIDGNNVLDSNNNAVGYVLFEVKGDDTSYPAIHTIVESGSGYDTHVRTAWYRRELGSGWDTAEKKMPAPLGVVLDRSGNRVNIKVEPPAGSDPFRYIGTMYLQTEEGERREILSDIIFYSEEYSVELPAEYASTTGKLVLEVCADSMYEDVEPSDPTASSDIPLDRPALPDPELRIELNRTESGTGGSSYSYRFHLTNQEDYENFDSYYISVKFMTPGSSNQTELRLVMDAQGNLTDNQWQMKDDSLQQLLIQAVPEDGNSLPSSEVSLPVYLPVSTPLIVLRDGGGNNAAVPRVSVTGSSLSDLSVTVTLDASGSGIVTTPPVYRAELIGSWEENGETISAVLAGTDMLTASNGSSTAVFTGLPEYIAGARDIRVRIWYAESGLGPVYTWHPLPDRNGANLYTLVNASAENGSQWEYGYSTLLDSMGTNDPMQDCLWNSERLFTWLPRPNLTAVGSSLVPQFDGDNRLQYVFSWDQALGEYQEGQTYLVSLTGIRGNDRVSIVSGVEVSGKTYTADAENWAYEQVELTVTRKGSGEKGSIGLSSSGTYLAGQRLPRPSQPSAVNPDVNELYYAVEWLPVVPENGCVFYEITLQPYEEDGVTLAAPQKLGEVAAGKIQENGLYRALLNLEPYAGQRALIYVTAKADNTDLRYVDSVAGISCELAIPARIGTPHVKWEKSWIYDRTSPITAAEFEQSAAAGGGQAGGLTVTITPDADSIPPGDSSYLLKAYVFDTEEDAQKAEEALAGNEADWDEGGLLTVYPARGENGIVLPAVMDMNTGDQYSHTLQGLQAKYAGKWILFCVRISSGNGQVSSGWSEAQIWQLPYVKLPSPSAEITSSVRSITAAVQTNPDLPAKEETWTANHTVLEWSSVELADANYVTLTKKSTDEAEPERYLYRILETEEETDAGTVRHAVIEQYREDTLIEGGTPVGSWQETARASWMRDENENWILQRPEGAEPEDGQTAILELSDYSFPVSGSYTEAELVTLYTITPKAVLEAVCENDGFRYTLVLPDTDSLIPKEGISISDAGLRLTDSVKIEADCQENLPDGSGQSDAYVRSDAYTAVFGN